ncbi:hypothetical protein, partial [Hydromonas duriensis]|uniref:hypothetical protein n=1 Tax=Hydromonas duriensis TaxID=1527608 RepID=UPI0013C2B21F
GFDSDVSVVGTPTITKGSNVSGTVNSAFTGAGTNTSIISNESIAAGSTATPTTETYDINVRVKVAATGSSTNNTCTAATGNGLFNNAQMTIAGTVKDANACAATPTAQTSQLTLKVDWVNATVGEKVTVPATTGLTTNTAAFDAVSTGTNSVSSSNVVTVINDTVTLPTPSFATAGNDIFYGSPTSWLCSDGVNPDVTVAFGSTFNFASKYTGNSVVCNVVYTSVVAGVNVTKAVTAGPTAVSGTGDQFDITYRVTVSNTNASATAYSLSDTFGFDSDVTVVGTPTITKGSNVSGTVNSAFTGSGTNTSIISNESIAAGSTATPTTETYDITVRVKVAATGSTTNNTCTATTGNGLFNNAQMTIAGTVKDANACATTPTAQTTQLTFQVDWSSATVGEKVSVPASTGLNTNTTAFDAVSTGSNTVKSNTALAVVGETVTVPTPSFAVAGNEIFYGSPTSWLCSDGVNPDVTVAFGSTLAFDSKYAGQTMACKVVYTSVVAGVNVTKAVTAGPTAVSGTGDQFDITYRVTVSNT